MGWAALLILLQILFWGWNHWHGLFVSFLSLLVDFFSTLMLLACCLSTKHELWYIINLIVQSHDLIWLTMYGILYFVNLFCRFSLGYFHMYILLMATKRIFHVPDPRICIFPPCTELSRVHKASSIKLLKTITR